MLRSGFPNGELILRADKVRELESVAAELDGIPTYELMKRAGAASFRNMRAHWPKAQNIVVLCGRGNNGGDGFVLAMLAHEAGLNVTVMMPDTGASKGDAVKARAQCTIPVVTFSADSLASADLIVDALLGIGLNGALRDDMTRVVRAINHANRPVFALDCPTGLQADSGKVDGECVKAELTLAFIALKPGLLSHHAQRFAGELVLDSLGILSSTSHSVAPDGEYLHHADWHSQLQKRASTTHKGQCGHVLVIGGAAGMGGAARLCAEAALRSGAGLVSAYCQQASVTAIIGARPEIMAHGFIEHPESVQLSPLVQKATVLAIGPGLSQAPWVKSLLEALLNTHKPVVLDADALNVLATHPMEVPQAVLTPHPGEAARLLGQTVTTVEADRMASVKAIQQKYKAAAVVLKGANSVVTDGHHFSVIAEGNPAMATGGMGDVLTGIIAALLAQGLSAFDAARLGASLHAWAGDRAADDIGSRGLVASDLFRYLPRGLTE